uniref:cyclin-dependent kinase n=1 Tax=Panagrolaimus superbus TaxID=310955 RepID=A0A914Z4V1_9BILA
MSKEENLREISPEEGGLDEEEQAAREASVRRSLIAKRKLKRQSDDKERKEVVDDDDDDAEYFSIQPEKRRHKDSPESIHLSKNGEEDSDSKSSERDSAKDNEIVEISKSPEERTESQPRNDNTRSMTPDSKSSKVDEGLSSSPDSFKDAAIPISPNTPDADNHENPDDSMEGDKTMNDSENDENETKPTRHIADEDIKEITMDDLTEEEIALLSPEQKRKLEERTQAFYISKLPKYFPGLSGCRSVSEYNCLNKIDEGTFGIVYRAQEKRTGDICALKRLKLERERDGFPVTSLREVNLLLMCRDHPNVVNVKEIVVGNHMDKVYLVMEYVEHDLKALIDQLRERGKKFTTGQVKTLTLQLLSGLSFMHDNWIIHRDLKTSNLLLSHEGILKIGDFGLARTYGQPLKAYTPIVVTLWYRSPELLLGTKKYATSVDMWSVGCILAEFIRLKPLFMGKGEIDQIDKIFHELGTPSDDIWVGYSSLPAVKSLKFKNYPCNQLRKIFGTDIIGESGLRLLNSFFIYDPDKRITADAAIKSEWFDENPLPTPPQLFPTWPAKSEKGKVPPPSKAPPPEPEPVIEINDATRELYEQFGVDPRKAKKAQGPFNLKLQ